MAKGTYLKREIVESAAFRKLSKTAILVFLFFCLKQRKEQRKTGKRGKEWVVTNNGELEFTYKEAEYKRGIKQSAFLEAIDRLIEVGFLDITESGAGLYKSKTLYALSDRWKEYGKPDFEVRKRKKDRRRIGFQKCSAQKKSSIVKRASPPLPVGKEGGSARTNGQTKRLHEYLPVGHPLRLACEDKKMDDKLAIYRRHGKSNAAE